MPSLGLSRLSRSLGALGVLAGCTDTGAHLTFSAPSGPGKVTSFEVVLATPELVPSVGGQRTSPSGLEEQTVSYYLQRTIAGGTHGAIDNVDGFAVRVEPDSAISETQFIPFVLMYEGDRVTGIATFRAPDSQLPAPILVQRDEIDKYVLDVEPTTQVDDVLSVGAGDVRVVTCYRDDQTPFTSGIVWRPKTGGELRLLFPDDGGLDATKRDLDLDCDQHPVTADSSGRDCDDTRDWFHHDAVEACDGFDTNCDGLQSLVVACSGTSVCPDPSTGTGVALCDDRTGTEGVCESDPQCECQASSTTCDRCVISTELTANAGTLKPCQPGLGYMRMDPDCSDLQPCLRVEVVKVGGGWRAKIAADLTSPMFGTVAQNVGAKLMIKVERPEGPGVELVGTRGASAGDLMLAVTMHDGRVELSAIDLQYGLDGGPCTGSGPFALVCYP